MMPPHDYLPISRRAALVADGAWSPRSFRMSGAISEIGGVEDDAPATFGFGAMRRIQAGTGYGPSSKAMGIALTPGYPTPIAATLPSASSKRATTQQEPLRVMRMCSPLAFTVVPSS